jgi:outer membrane biosynthesis protein TonB
LELRQYIRADIAASAVAHLSLLMLLLFFADVHPFGSVTAEPIAVDIVSPEQVAEVSKEPAPPPETPPLDISPFMPPSAAANPPAPAAPAPPPPEPAKQPQKQAAPSPPLPDRQQAAVQQQQQQPTQQPPAQQPPPSPAPAYVPPEPDLSVKYHVVLGLPQTSPGGDFDAPASTKADVASNLVTEFRRHLRTCSKLPESVAPSDKIKLKLRVFMAPDGKLAAEPILIEASASAKGPALMQSAISALEACQPYAMLPADRYGEWKMLDLSFTPQDFAGG